MDAVHQKLGELSATAKAAHQRMDKLEIGIRDDLKTLNKELKELNAYMNRGKGWAAAFVMLSGFAGAGMFKLLGIIFTK